MPNIVPQGRCPTSPSVPTWLSSGEIQVQRGKLPVAISWYRKCSHHDSDFEALRRWVEGWSFWSLAQNLGSHQLRSPKMFTYIYIYTHNYRFHKYRYYVYIHIYICTMGQPGENIGPDTTGSRFQDNKCKPSDDFIWRVCSIQRLASCANKSIYSMIP